MTQATPPPLLKLSPTALVKTLLGLRGAAILAFPLATVLAAILQRGPLILLVLAAGMMAVHEVERRRLRHLTGHSKAGLPTGMLLGFAWRIALLAALFIVLIGLMALFRDTSLARGLGWVDLALLGGAGATALIANAVSARLAVARADAAVTAIRGAMQPPAPSPPGGPGDTGGGDIIEGEIIAPDAPP
jgi:hypothetical protein